MFAVPFLHGLAYLLQARMLVFTAVCVSACPSTFMSAARFPVRSRTSVANVCRPQ
jgi:hypothetical protein